MGSQLKVTSDFGRSIKRLARKYHSLPSKVNTLMHQLREQPQIGTPIGQGCYKIRLTIASKGKGKGKSGGARVITYVQVVGETAFLLAIYDKSAQASISDQQG